MGEHVPGLDIGQGEQEEDCPGQPRGLQGGKEGIECLVMIRKKLEKAYVIMLIAGHV